MQKEKITIDLKLPKKWEDLDNPLTLGKKKTKFLSALAQTRI